MRKRKTNHEGRSIKRGRSVRESDWIRVDQIRENVWRLKPKSVESGIDPSQFEKIWPELSRCDKLDLCAAYAAKAQLSKQDEKILDFVIANGDDVVWSSIASVLTRHTDRQRISAFLRNRIEEQEPPLANFFQAAEILKDTEAIPQLKKKYLQYQEAGVTSQYGDRVSCIDLLSCSRALWTLTHSAEFGHTIEQFLDARDEIVRNFAKHCLTKREDSQALS